MPVSAFPRTSGNDVEGNMAVSQYLRPGSLLDSLTNCFTAGAVKSASSLIGAAESPTRSALRIAAPSVFGAMAEMASTGEGAQSLFSMIQDGGYHALVDDPAALFNGSSTTSSMMSAGRQVTDRLFGERSASVAETVAKASGLGAAPAGTLLNLVAPLALGVVEKEILYRGLDASGVRALLLDQKGEFDAALPPRIPQIVAFPARGRGAQRRVTFGGEPGEVAGRVVAGPGGVLRVPVDTQRNG